MKRYLILLIAATLIGVITATTIPAEAAFPGGNGDIVFSSELNGQHKIYRMHPDGTGLTQLTFFYDTTPAWSPDGTRISFESKRDNVGGREVYVMNADGTGQTRLTINPGFTNSNSEWSPDGTRIVFSSNRDGNYEIYVMNVDGSNPTNLTKNSADDTAPAWSPDGTKIAFTSDRDGNDEIYVMNPDSTGQTNLTNDPSGGDYNPDWSPDGTLIAFNSNRNAIGGIYVMNPDGTGQTCLTNYSDSRPAWSPDGTKIAFNSYPTYYADIYVMDADGSNRTQLTTTYYHDYSPSWQPILSAQNHPPVLDPIGNRLGSEGQPLGFVITASDPDPEDTLTFGANNLPEGATFNSDTATFSWTPGYDQAGEHTDVEFNVQDNGDPIEVDLELINITIGNVNQAPVFTTIGPQLVLENEPLTFTVSATDPDLDDVFLSSGELPSGASFNITTGLFSWVPDYWMAGTYPVVFSASDDGEPNLTSDLEVVITVGDVPAPAEMTEEIIEIITSEALNLPQEVENSYLANLKKVSIFVDKNKLTPAINQLDAFISKVEKDIQQGKMDAEVGNDLIDKATEIIQKITP